MLTIHVQGAEYYDKETDTFFTIESETLELENSLKSLTEWEAVYKESFFDSIEKGFTPEQMLEYIRCMAIKKPKDPRIFLCITGNELKQISAYITEERTATTFMELKKVPMSKKQKITSEIIYWWMIESDIPFECDTWNLSHLLALIRVVSIKRSNGKMSDKDRNEFNRALMAKRRAGK